MALPAVATGPQFGVTFILVGPDGTRAVFNNTTDADYVGMLTDVTGLDNPEVRESADNIVEGDGGVHGSFYYGRRPITLEGMIVNPTSPTNRNQKMTQLMRACNAMRSDALLTWTPTGGVQQAILVRKQQPLRISGTWQKTFQLSLVAADPRIYAYNPNTANVNAASVGTEPGVGFDLAFDMFFPTGTVLGQLFVSNNGNAVTYPVLTVEGPVTNPSITNVTTGETIALTYTLTAGESLVIDTLNHTVLLNNTTSRYGAVDFQNTQWWGLNPGTNELQFLSIASASPAQLVVTWRDAWL